MFGNFHNTLQKDKKTVIIKKYDDNIIRILIVLSFLMKRGN